MNAKIILTVLGIGAAAGVTTVATTDRYDETLSVPSEIVQYKDGEVYEYPSVEDASVITNLSEEEIIQALQNQTTIDGFRYTYKYD